jgi:hypothetical protein
MQPWIRYRRRGRIAAGQLGMFVVVSLGGAEEAPAGTVSVASGLLTYVDSATEANVVTVSQTNGAYALRDTGAAVTPATRERDGQCEHRPERPGLCRVAPRRWQRQRRSRGGCGKRHVSRGIRR